MDAAALYLYAIDCAPLLYSALTHTVLGTNVHKERVDDNKATGPSLAISPYIFTLPRKCWKGGEKKQKHLQIASLNSTPNQCPPVTSSKLKANSHAIRVSRTTTPRKETKETKAFDSE
jgi:hypothetical protein